MITAHIALTTLKLQRTQLERQLLVSPEHGDWIRGALATIDWLEYGYTSPADTFIPREASV